MRLFPRLLIIFLTLILIPLGFVGTLVYTNAKIHITNSMIHSLEAIADYRKGSIEAFEYEQRSELQDLQGHWIIRSKLPLLIRYAGQKDSPSYIETTAAMDKHFSQLHEHHKHLDIVLFDPAGRLVYANAERWRGLIGLKPESHMRHLFESGKSGIFFGSVREQPREPVRILWGSAPIRAGDRLLGVLAMQVDIDELIAKLNTRKGLGETGEILAGMIYGEEVMLINDLRHSQNTASLAADTMVPLVKAARGMGGSGIARDYRGHPVIAVWRHVPAMNWGLVVKIDVKEALHTVYELRRITLLIGVIATIFGALIAWVMARPLAADVRKLIEGADAIGGGDLNFRLEMPNEGEFSELAGSFNRMADDMLQATNERSRIMEELGISEGRFRTMVANISGAVYRCASDENRSIEFISNGIEKLSGFPATDFLNGRRFSDIIHAQDKEMVQQSVAEAVRNGEPYSLRYRIVDSKGKIRWVMERGQATYSIEKKPLLDGVIIDISEQVRAEEDLHAAYERLKNTQKASMNIMEDLERQRDALRQALEEREVLLREIHHRVKNNLQIISALLELQGKFSSDAQTQEFFRDSQARIRSMALVHEKLYRLESLSRIDFGEYIRDLLDNIMLQFPGVLEKEAVTIDVPDIMLPIDKAIPCGLIVNELATNVFKYAFPNGRQGKLDISMHEEGSGAIILTVKDNGVGLPKGLDIESGKTFGMYIVHSLTERQLGGSIQMESDHGASFVIRFNKGDTDE